MTTLFDLAGRDEDDILGSVIDEIPFRLTRCVNTGLDRQDGRRPSSGGRFSLLPWGLLVLGCVIASVPFADMSGAFDRSIAGFHGALGGPDLEVRPRLLH
jgi:hypothetical protein